MENYQRTLDYIKLISMQTTPLYTEMEAYAAENRIPILDEYAANVLEWVVKTKIPGDVLEVGTAIGYSSIRIASCLRPGEKLITLEKSSESFQLANTYINRSGFADTITVLFGEAILSIDSLPKESFACIFLDADKKDYTPLLQPLIDLLIPGGVLFVDNLLWHGHIVREDTDIPVAWMNSTKLVREFNEIFFHHPQLHSILLPVGDGLGLGTKR